VIMRGHAIQRLVRQSPRKMRLVIDLIRGKDVNEAYAILQFNKKHAALTSNHAGPSEQETCTIEIARFDQRTNRGHPGSCGGNRVDIGKCDVDELVLCKRSLLQRDLQCMASSPLVAVSDKSTLELCRGCQRRIDGEGSSVCA